MGSLVPHIALFITSLRGGGAQRVLVNLANALADDSIQVSVITFSESSTDAFELKSGVNRLSLGRPPRRVTFAPHDIGVSLTHAFKLRQTLENLGAQAVISFLPRENMLLALAKAGTGVVGIGSEHSHPPSRPYANNPIFYTLRYITYGLLDSVTAPTLNTAMWLRRHSLAPNVVVIPNMIANRGSSNTLFEAPSQEAQRRKRILLAMGRLEWIKGFDILVDCFSDLAALYPEWNLMIIGEGRERSKLESQIRRLGLEDRIFLPGWSSDVDSWYRRSSLFVLSSRAEGFANALVEAMCYGLPVVAFNCPVGPADIVTSEFDGLLVPPEDRRGLNRSLERLMQDEALRTQLGRRAVNACQHYGQEPILHRWKKLLSRLGVKCVY